MSRRPTPILGLVRRREACELAWRRTLDLQDDRVVLRRVVDAELDDLLDDQVVRMMVAISWRCCGRSLFHGEL